MKRSGRNVINARIETAAEKPAFRDAWKKRRCAIPASGWFEWKTLPTEGKGKPLKQPFYITRKDGAPISFAGLWERWKQQDGLLSCSIIATEASNGTRNLHSRMPVVLDNGKFDAWLSGEPPQLAEDIDEVLRFLPVSPRMNKPQHNAPDCIEELGHRG